MPFSCACCLLLIRSCWAWDCSTFFIGVPNCSDCTTAEAKVCSSATFVRRLRKRALPVAACPSVPPRYTWLSSSTSGPLNRSVTFSKAASKLRPRFHAHAEHVHDAWQLVLYGPLPRFDAGPEDEPRKQHRQDEGEKQNKQLYAQFCIEQQGCGAPATNTAAVTRSRRNMNSCTGMRTPRAGARWPASGCAPSSWPRP